MKKHIYQLVHLAFDTAKKHVANYSTNAKVELLVNPESIEAVQRGLLDLFDVHYALRAANPEDPVVRQFNQVNQKAFAAYRIWFEISSNAMDPNYNRFGHYRVEGFTHLFIDHDFPKRIKGAKDV